MGRNSQRRRAAKLREQQDRRRLLGAPHHHPASPASPEPPQLDLPPAKLSAVPPPSMPPRVVGSELDQLLADGTAHALSQGWSGADLIHVARCKDAHLDQLQAMFLSSASALDGVDEVVRGEFVDAWCARERNPVLARALAEMLAARLLHIRPIPRRRTTAGARASTDVLAKIRALLAKAEATTYPAEAEAFTAKAQEMMSRHAIDQAMVDASAGLGDADRGMSVGRVLLEEPYLNQKADLLHVIARANGCRAVSHGKVGMATVVGDTDDLDMVELLFTSLLLQATVAMQDAGRRDAGDRTRGFRAAFLTSFAVRVGERLEDARLAATAHGERTYGSALVPVMAAKEERVESAVREMFPHLGSRSGSRSLDARGWEAGRRAAERADVGSSKRIAS